MVNWEKVTRPKKLGGLGLRQAHRSNIALLGKLVWALEHHKDKLWLSSSLHGMANEQSWSWVWKTVGPEKYRLFVWLILQEALPTNSLRLRRHLANSAAF